MRYFNNHPIWYSLKERLRMGCDFPKFPLKEETVIKGVEGTLNRVNQTPEKIN